MPQIIGSKTQSDASELSRFRELLGSEEFSIPLGSNFFIQIESIPTAIANTENLNYFEVGRKNKWNIADGTNNLININDLGIITFNTQMNVGIYNLTIIYTLNKNTINVPVDDLIIPSYIKNIYI